RQDQHVEPLVRLDEGVDQPHGIRRVNVVINLAVHEQQGAFQVGRQLGVGRHLNLEADLLLFGLDVLLFVLLLVFLLVLGVGGRLLVFLLGVVLRAVLVAGAVTIAAAVLGGGAAPTGAGSGADRGLAFTVAVLLDDDLPQPVVPLRPGVV